ncbi:hypothetical protein BGZ73_007294, partial [Actinomortierella ambigua]
MSTNINEPANGCSTDLVNPNSGRGKGFKLWEQLWYVGQNRTRLAAMKGIEANKVTQGQYHELLEATLQAT